MLSKQQYSQTLPNSFVLHSPVVAGKAPIIGHLTLTSLMAAYQHHSCKRPAQVRDTFSCPKRCLLTRAFTVVPFSFWLCDPPTNKNLGTNLSLLDLNNLVGSGCTEIPEFNIFSGSTFILKSLQCSFSASSILQDFLVRQKKKEHWFEKYQRFPLYLNEEQIPVLHF